METRWEEFWWNYITGPNVVVSSVVSALLNGKMVVLKVPSDLPWRHSMRSAVHTAFSERSDCSDVVIELIDLRDENARQMQPGRFILDRFATPTISRGYREKSKVTVQDYISAKDIIKNRIVWIKGIDPDIAGEWIRFCRGFSQRSAAQGLFVLEVNENTSVTETNLLRVINFSDCVSNYDVQLFNSFVLGNQKQYSDGWKKYIAVCTAAICGVDAEISQTMLQSLDFRVESPLEGIRQIDQMPDFMRRGENGSNHVLWHYRNGDMALLEHRLWSAQVQVLFPMIELERVELIGRYERQIREVLASGGITQYNQILQEPMDVELGTLSYLMGAKMEDGFYTLYIPSEEDRKRIRFLHTCRNQLAHASCCTPEQVEQLLK